MRKFFRGICGVLATLLTLCILLMAAGLMGVRAFGITPYVVPADMEGLPWSAGALLYVRQEQPETLQPGDTIAYVTDSDLSLEGGVIGSVDTEQRFFYVEGTPVYWDNVLGQPLWGIDGLGYVSGYISRPPGLYLVLGAAVVLALLCIFPLRRRKGEKTEESPTGRCMATNVGEKAPTESVQAAAMEDFKNWNCYAGRSTDSYAATRGSDGPFTGAADYLGSPLFFKEDCVERVYPSAAGAHQIVTVRCPGVRKGSGRSLQTVEGVLYYHGCGGVYAFDGSMPQRVSQALGEDEYHGAVAGGADFWYNRPCCCGSILYAVVSKWS